MAIQVLCGVRCAVTGMGGHLILEYQKSVTTHASHSADRWVFGNVFKHQHPGVEQCLIDTVCTPMRLAR